MQRPSFLLYLVRRLLPQGLRLVSSLEGDVTNETQLGARQHCISLYKHCSVRVQCKEDRIGVMCSYMFLFRARCFVRNVTWTLDIGLWVQQEYRELQ